MGLRRLFICHDGSNILASRSRRSHQGHIPGLVTFNADSRVVVFQACVQTDRFSSERKLKCLELVGQALPSRLIRVQENTQQDSASVTSINTLSENIQVMPSHDLTTVNLSDLL